MVGVIFVGLGLLLAGLSLFVEPPLVGVGEKPGVLDRSLLAFFLVFSGLLAGGPFIVFGQLLNIFLDQRALLARILRELRQRQDPA